jgi:outer membrane biogenesis lipoprotein LolB
MKKLIAVVAFLTLTGCASITDMIPSRWDANQSKSITDIQQQTRRFDCKGDQAAQINELAKSVEWFDIYANSAGTKDILKLTSTLDKTVQEYQERVKTGPVSPLYCDLKKKILQQQADILAGSVQGRF